MAHSRILIWGDPHYKRDNVESMVKLGQFILNVVISQKPDLFVCLGDVMDTHERCYMDPYTAAFDFFTELTKHVKVVTLVGNHDRENNQDFMTNKHFLRGFPGQVVDMAVIDSHDPRIMYVPYVPPGRFNEAISHTWHPGVKVCFAHQEFRGAQDNFHVSEIAEEADPRMLIFSGHYHRYQVMGNLIYVGTVQHRFGDCADNALIMYDINANTYERIPIVGLKKKVTVDFTIDDIPQIEQYLAENHQHSDVRVNISVPYGHPANLKDPTVRNIVAMAKSVVFHRSSVRYDDQEVVRSGPIMPSYREIFGKMLTETEKATLAEHNVIV